MRPTRRTTALALAAVTALALTACSDDSDNEPTSSLGLPDGISENVAATAGAGLAATDGPLWVVTYGSSTNPLVAGDVSADGQTVTVELTNDPDAPATADLVPTTSFVDLPDDVAADEPIDVVLGDLGTVTVDPADVGSVVWLDAEG
ncbi:hypothetical protein AGMMS50218_17140 [Actinomycetota bacterium]|nr:hypothetical protein AGMMS50218_17140 [Actinomycetota bacterium]